MASKTVLDGKRINAFGYDPDDLVIVGIDTNDGPEHPLYDVTFRHEVDNSMVLNIMELGIISPVTVCKVPDGSERGYSVVVVDGRRRVIHAREAKRKMAALGDPGSISVPCTLQKGDEGLLEKVSVAANFVRQEDTTLTRAERVSKLLRRNGGDYEDAAIAAGISSQTVRMYEKMMDLSAGVKKAINSGAISAHAAVKFSHLPKCEQDAKIAEMSAKTPDGKKITRRSASRATTGSKAPGRAMLRDILKAHEETKDVGTALNEDFVLGLRFALGLVSSGEVAGLNDLLVRSVDKDAETEGQA